MTSMTLRWLVLIILGVVALAGCGSEGTSASDPLSTDHQGSATDPTIPATVQDNTLSLKASLTSDKSTTGIESDVLLTVTVTDMQEKPLQNQVFNFSVVAGPATILDPAVRTDSAGKAVSRLRVGSTSSSSSIVVKAYAPVAGGSEVSAYTTIQVVRQNSYTINFLTSMSTTDPSGNLNTLSGTVGKDFIGRVTFKQLVPFQVLDNNGVPKPGVSVDIGVFNYGRSPDTVIELAPPWPGIPVVFPPTPGTPPGPMVVTVITDDHGKGIFTCNVTMDAPVTPGTSNTESIIYSATATIASDNVNLLSYGGFIATVLKEK